MITVYYDGKCGLCSREIKYYKSIAPEGIFNWQDVMQSPNSLEEIDVSLADALRYLHVKTKDGTVLVGAESFIHMWQQMKYWNLLAKFASLPGIKQFASFIYKKFADRRFNRLEHCQVAART